MNMDIGILWNFLCFPKGGRVPQFWQARICIHLYNIISQDIASMSLFVMTGFSDIIHCHACNVNTLEYLITLW